jgi:hypothetical protein
VGVRPRRTRCACHDGAAAGPGRGLTRLPLRSAAGSDSSSTARQHVDQRAAAVPGDQRRRLTLMNAHHQWQARCRGRRAGRERGP